MSALTRTLLPPIPGLGPLARRRAEEDVVAYVHGQIARMPAFLRLPFRLVLVVFACGALLRHRRSFAALGAVERAGYVNLWAVSPIIPMRDVIKMIRSCALLAWFDHPAVSAVLQRDEADRGAVHT